MLPEGLDVLTEEDDIAMNLAVIGEDIEFDQNISTSPAEAVRSAIANKKKASLIPDSKPALNFVAPRPSLNAVLQRMAARYGHDPKQLDSLVRDLNVV